MQWARGLGAGVNSATASSNTRVGTPKVPAPRWELHETFGRRDVGLPSWLPPGLWPPPPAAELPQGSRKFGYRVEGGGGERAVASATMSIMYELGTRKNTLKKVAQK